MKPALLTAALLTALAGPPALANSAKALAEAVLPSKTRMKVTSPAFAQGGVIPQNASSYGKNISPALNWSGAPAGTRSFVLMVEDPDAPGPTPFEQWLVYNIPGAARGLPAGSLPAGAVVGLNSAGKPGYFGPMPPAGPAHHYHFQVFALDQPLNLSPVGGRVQVLAAMRGHVLAEGDLMGLYRKP